MATLSTVVYQGELRCKATHAQSKAEFVTDAPTDNHGKGESFSPTDLLGASMGACMLTIMGIAAEQRGIDISGTTVEVRKHMVADPHRRVSALPAKVTIVKPVVNLKDRELLERAALGCPVHHSLDPRIERPIEFVWL